MTEASGSSSRQALPNPRLDRFNQALDGYADRANKDKKGRAVLDLLDDKVRPETIRSIIPNLNPDELEYAIKEFTEELKRRILESSEIIGDKYNLADRLAELEQLAREADERAARGVKPDSEEGKDAWRPGMGIERAVNARAAVAHKEHVDELQKELEELEEANAVAHKEMRKVAAQAAGRQLLAREALDAIEEATKGLSADEQTQARIRTCITALIEELGPRAMAA